MPVSASAPTARTTAPSVPVAPRYATYAWSVLDLQPRRDPVGRLRARIGLRSRLRQPLAALQRRGGPARPEHGDADRARAPGDQRARAAAGRRSRHRRVARLPSRAAGAPQRRGGGRVHGAGSAHRRRPRAARAGRGQRDDRPRVVDGRPPGEHVPARRRAHAHRLVVDARRDRGCAARGRSR